MEDFFYIEFEEGVYRRGNSVNYVYFYKTSIGENYSDEIKKRVIAKYKNMFSLKHHVMYKCFVTDDEIRIEDSGEAIF